ncbi:MAG: TolC family protein [Bacteroidales bacterium]|nr:TolC family protein [Bacteroidales bacterium]
MKHKLGFQKIHLSVALVLLLINILNVSPSYAQNTVKYTLDEVIRIAQQQSPDAITAKHRFRRSYWSFRSFKATYLPGIRLNATLPNLSRSIDPIDQPSGAIEYIPRSISNYSVDLSINQKVGFSGGEVFLSSGILRQDNYRKSYITNNDTVTQQFVTNMINIGFRQPIFNYNPYKWDRKIEPLKYLEAQRAFIEANEQVAVTAVNEFFSLLLSQIEMLIALKNQSNYDTLYRIALGRYNLGKIAENELLQLELNLLKAEATVETADLNYRNSLFSFKSYLRLKDDFPVELIPPVITPDFKVPVQEAVEEAKANTSIGIEFKRRLLEAESELNRAKREGRFDAELFAVFGLTQTSDVLQEAYRNPRDEERVTLGITVPILDWGEARGNIRVAESNQYLVMTAVEQDRIDFEQSVFLQVMQFNIQQKQLTIAAKSDTVAQKRFNITQKRYLIGKVNDVLELNNAQIDNDNARMNYYRSLMNYWKNYYGLRRLTLFDFERKMQIMVGFDDLIE